MFRKLKSTLFLLVICYAAIYAQVEQVEYGKNRIQYHDDFDQWLFYESENFITYWYGKARNHGISTVKYAEQDHDEILDIIEHRINDKIQILVYTDVSDLKQSNIGHEESFHTEAGRTKIEGSKIFVQFDGNHGNLRRDIRRGVARIFLNNMFFGSNLQEVVQNSVSAAIPEWFQGGLSDYVGSYWDHKSDDQLRNIFLHERKTDFKRISAYYPNIVGHSLWYYIGVTYGKSEISNLLYLTRINRSVEDAFLYVFGIPFEEIVSQWEQYFKKRYEAEQELFQPIIGGEKVTFKRKKRVPVSHLRYSPDGTRLVIIDNNISKTRILLRDLQTGQIKKIFKHGYRNNLQATDYNYPMVAWTPDGSGLFILYEYRDQITLKLINFRDGSTISQVLPERYQRVYSMDCLSEKELIFSALSEGMVDLFYYTPNTRQSNQLTKDIYDELDVRIGEVDGVNGILFSSNRPDAYQRSSSVDTVLPFENFNLFHLALEEEGTALYQITKETGVDLRKPVPVGDGIVYLSYANGIINRKMVQARRAQEPRIRVTFTDESELVLPPTMIDSLVDSLIVTTVDTFRTVYESTTKYLTNYLHNIQEFDVDAGQGKAVETFYKVNDYVVYEKPLSDRTVQANTSLHHQIIDQQKDIPEEVIPIAPSAPKPSREIIRSSKLSDDGKKYLFQSEFGDMESDEAEEILEAATSALIVPTTNVVNRKTSSVDSLAINRLRIVPYQLKFKLHSLSANMDNDPLFGGLDSYTAFKREYEPPPIGVLIKSSFKDLFEDYVFEGGVRIPTGFNGAEFFLVHDDRKNRLDKRYAVYRRTISENQALESGDPARIRTKILLGQFGVRYPLDIYHSLRATATLRQDKTTVLASDINSLNSPDLEAQRFGVKLEYVFDNSLDIDLNIRSGTRFKVFTEAVKKFSFSIDPLSLQLSKGFMTVIGTDARHYLNFFKHSVLAGRLAAATSFGSEKILYFLGGSDNWLIPKFNDQIPQPTGGNFAFQTISPSLRGFDYNIRNGSTYALVNTELRLPLFKYFSRRPIKMSFIRHLQLVGFADAGAAWEGISPFDEENPINIVNLENPPTVKLKVNYYRDPIVIGYGVGLRTMLFGYFLRLDYAWGVETRITQKPKLHFSMGLDF
ncbi:MAG: hypothetical protein HKN87_14340 [Saprospiraceae bacterium]|nr:hypothetical protein [Saprospiraceae bacterium]